MAGPGRGRGKEAAGAPDGPDRDPDWVDRIRRSMLKWFEGHGREGLPWRRDRDPYRVLVAEVMLVQTTVAAVGPYFERFVARFPTAEALATADESEVLKAWEGLGYYRRARQLQAAARALVADHGGRISDDPEVIRRLPGVGPYIAGAVLSIAFDRPEPILEANSQRVLARWIAWPNDVRASASQSRLWEAAARLVPVEGAGRFNQALMDLGATVCTVKAPLCLACPVAADCRARREGLQDDLPVRASREAPLEVAEACVLAIDDLGRFLVVRRTIGRLWERLHEFPTVHRSGVDPAGRGTGAVDLAEGIEALTGVALRVGRPLQTIRYGVTKHRVTLAAHVARPVGGSPRPGTGLEAVEWLTLDQIDGRSRTAATRRLAAWAAANRDQIDSEF